MISDRRLEVPFVRNAWMAGMWPYTVFLLVVLVIDHRLRVVRADQFASAYPQFLAGDIGPDQLPNYDWFPLVQIVALAHVAHLTWRRFLRSPSLRLDEGTIRTSFTESSTKQVAADRVTEVQVDEKRSLIRFLVPDGLSLAVRADLLDSGHARPGDLADGFAGALGVPVVPVRRRLWRWTPDDLSATPV